MSNGGKAGTIYMLLVAICGVFFVCLCRLDIFGYYLHFMVNTREAMAEMASMAPTA